MTNLIHLKKEIEDIKKLPYYSQVDGVLEVKRARLQGYQLAVEDFEKMIDELEIVEDRIDLEYEGVDYHLICKEELKSKTKRR